MDEDGTGIRPHHCSRLPDGRYAVAVRSWDRVLSGEDGPPQAGARATLVQASGTRA